MSENKITLDALMKQSQLNVPVQSKEEIAQEVVKEVETLTADQRMKVDKIKNEIDMQDSTLLTVYGSESQKNIAQFSDAILAEVRSKDAGEIGNLMSELMLKVKDLDIANIEDEGFFAKIPFFNNAKRSIDKYLAKFDSMEGQIDKIQAQLENARMELLKDISTFDKLYEKNVEYFNDLQLYIVAGEEKVKEMQETVIPNLLAEAKTNDDPMAVQVVHDFQDTVNRFEKKIYDLKISKTVAIQTAPQIKLIQNNDKLLVDKVSDAITNTIPLWKSQVVIALGMNKQKRVLEMQKEVSDTTNELLRRNAESLKTNTIEIAKEAERSTVEIETLKKVNEDLISTIEESLAIHNNAKKARQAAEVEIAKIESDLKSTFIKSVNV